MRGPRSLRLRLWLSGAAGIALAALAAAWLLGAAFERAVMDAFDRRLADDLVTVAGVLARDGNGDVRLRREPADGRYARPFSGHYWQVGEGPDAFRSRSMWDFTPALPAGEGARASGMHYHFVAGPSGQQLRSAEQWLRLPGVAAPVRVWVASDQAIPRAQVAQFRWLAGGSVALLAAGLLLAAAAQVRYGLRPLQGIATLLAKVRSGESERLDAATLPTEVRPLADHLNQLLDHHEQMVARARDSAQDLAHALKTPLAVLDAGAQQPGPALPDTVREQVARMRAVVERQLAASTPVDRRLRTPVAPVLERLVHYLRQAFASRALAFDVRADAALRFGGRTEDLEEMLGNLLENAAKWARACVHAEAGHDARGLWIEVRDDGPGLPPGQREAALQRGVRLDERVAGSGLGLAITSDLAAAHGGWLELGDAPEGGLLARLVFPDQQPSG